MVREIGSEFHRMPLERGSGLSFPGTGALVFSGRTAIETVLKQLPRAKKAVLPSYCCDSMLEPFRKAGIAVSFYPVEYRKGLQADLHIPEDADILLWCHYFGFHTPLPDVSAFRARGGAVIEDITHSLLSDVPCSSQADYYVASVRKWEPVLCGGYCAAAKGCLPDVPQALPPETFLMEKTAAMEQKAAYLERPEEGEKARFLARFGESNHWLAEHYTALAIDPVSADFIKQADVQGQKAARRRNARVLYEGLRGKIPFLFREEEMDCPLFVPVLLENRDEVRQRLTANGIYCPVHWPRPEGCRSNLYEMELSLICDQRYDDKDMKRILSVLNF